AVKRGEESVDESLQHFNRWPTWMWANEEVRSFLNWLSEWNGSHDEKAGFYGLDVYSLTESMTEVLRLLRERDPAGYQQAKKLLDCFHFYGGTREEYARAVALVARSCEKEAVDLLVHLR